MTINPISIRCRPLVMGGILAIGALVGCSRPINTKPQPPTPEESEQIRQMLKEGSDAEWRNQ